MTTAPQSSPTPRHERLLIERLPHGGWVVFDNPEIGRLIMIKAFSNTADMLDGLVQLVL